MVIVGKINHNRSVSKPYVKEYLYTMDPHENVIDMRFMITFYRA